MPVDIRVDFSPSLTDGTFGLTVTVLDANGRIIKQPATHRGNRLEDALRAYAGRAREPAVLQARVAGMLHGHQEPEAVQRQQREQRERSFAPPRGSLSTTYFPTQPPDPAS
jgi:hypothetical protein